MAKNGVPSSPEGAATALLLSLLTFSVNAAGQRRIMLLDEIAA